MTTQTSAAGGSAVRVRFCPSPTGAPHVGLIRTALFNWAFARHHGGSFVFRIEDTDAARDDEESYRSLLDGLRWLGLDWDEGPEVGGAYSPYRQSERGELYRDVIHRLVAAGEVYESFSTPEEVGQRHREAGRDPKLGYDGYDRHLTEAQRAAFRAEGRSAVLRLPMPQREIGWTDAVRGPVSFPAGSVPDPVLVRGNSEPLYTLVNPTDDALMGITHVLRGEDLLSSTPRQIALYEALIRVGVADRVPDFGHLPYVMGEGNKKLSKRDPQADLLAYQRGGFLPEGLVNYLALLGWSIAEDRDVFTLPEMVQVFDVGTVSGNPARFDLKKAEAINATHLRGLDVSDFLRRVAPFLQQAGLLPSADPEQLPAHTREVLTEIAPMVQQRCVVLTDAVTMLRFLLVEESEFALDPDAAGKTLADADEVLTAALEELSRLSDWERTGIEHALKDALVEGLGIKPRKAFAPVRVAITGRTVSPPLYESMELLGRDRVLRRLTAARSYVPG